MEHTTLLNTQQKYKTMKINHLLCICIALLTIETATAQIVYINNAGDESALDTTLWTQTKEPDIKLKPVEFGSVKLLPGLFLDRYNLNRNYMLSLENKKLLQNFYYEAGLTDAGNIMVERTAENLDDMYWGWESPMNQLRGHFLGHWLSAAAYMYAANGDVDVKVKADQIVAELARCQEANGGEWVGSIPEKYLDFIAHEHHIWSPQYTLHKTLMGLYDMYAVAGSEQAFDIIDKFADWFHAWTDKLIEEGNAASAYQGETSGMLEIWAHMYGATHDSKYVDLMSRYGNPDIFQTLEAGGDALSNEHANASIPWSHGSARIYEVTGNEHWRDITLAFWKNAVDDRESFCTGGQNCGEHWIAPHELKRFVGENNQEHCTVYNMIRTAEYLYRWTGDAKYADYIERNIYNGILAQQHPQTGMIAYFLPMAFGYTKGGEKGWGHPTRDFFCCHGTLVQAHTRYTSMIYYESDNGLTVSQYIPSELTWKHDDQTITVTQDFKSSTWGKEYNGNRWTMVFHIKTERETKFDLTLRLPWWLKEKATITVNGNAESVAQLNGTHTISRTWNDDEIIVTLPTKLYTEALPEATNVAAIMEGPIVLAGISDFDIKLKGDASKPETFLLPEYEQQYRTPRWKQSHYTTVGQQSNIRLVPLYEIGDQKYIIYFTIEK